MNSNTYALWLPLNKDFFGFENYWDAPLNVFSKIYKDTYEIEHPILLRSQEIIKTINQKWQGYSYIFPAYPTNTNNVRVVEFTINDENEKDIGTFKIFSHGLYLWNLKEPLDKDEFMEHIKMLFHTDALDDWEKNIDKKDERNFFDNYDGLLNYFQLELLEDILYNVHIAPSVFFHILKEKSFIKDVKSVFSLFNILKSNILYTDKEGMKPFSKRESYVNILNDVDTFYLASTMEHFIRVANTFSMEHYRRGLHYCLKNLSEIGNFRTDMSKNTVNYNFPSILTHKASMRKLESYHTMMYEKLPHLKYLNSLYQGLKKSYLKTNNEGIEQAIEQNSRRLQTINDFFYSIEKLIEQENTKNIHYEIAELRKNHEIINQLSSDTTHSDNREVSPLVKKLVKEMSLDNSNIINQIMLRLTKIAVIIGFITIFMGIFSPIVSAIITDKDLKTFGDVIEQLRNIDAMWLVIMGMALTFFYKKTINYIEKESQNTVKNINTLMTKEWGNKDKEIEQKNEASLYVFDNSHIEATDGEGNGIYEKLIKYFSQKTIKDENINISIKFMPSLFNIKTSVACKKFNSIRERYRSYKLYKFTFSSEIESKTKPIRYTLDIDIQYDTLGDHETKIKNIRIAIIDEEHIDEDDMIEIYKNMRDIKVNLKESLEEYCGKYCINK